MMSLRWIHDDSHELRLMIKNRWAMISSSQESNGIESKRF